MSREAHPRVRSRPGGEDTMTDHPSRRQFLRMAGVGGGAALLAACAPAAPTTPTAPAAPAAAPAGSAPSVAAAGSFQQLLAAAREEAARGTFQVWALRPG